MIFIKRVGGKMRELEKNKGSATIEMTLLIPVFLSVLLLYISVFLSLLTGAKQLECMVNVLYVSEDVGQEKDGVYQQADTISTYFNETVKGVSIDLELHRKADTAVETIRRWQLARDVF